MIVSRSAVVFGGSGFLGRVVVQKLVEQGYGVRVPTRDPEAAKDLKVMGAVGQVVPFAASVRSDAEVAAALEGAELAVNLIGILSQTRRDKFQTLHVEVPARLARLARAAGVKHFVHVSALGADKTSSSAYARTKALGEEAVRAFFPEAILFRPSVMVGPQDRFLRRFEEMIRFSPLLPLIGGGKTRLQPVFVGDVATAMVVALARPEAWGKVFQLGGPEIYSFKALMEELLHRAGVRRLLLPVPWGAAMALAAVFERLLPSPPLTRDQLELLKKDNLVGKGSGILTFKDLGWIARKIDQI